MARQTTTRIPVDTALDAFTREIFVAGGAPHPFGLPTDQPTARKLPVPRIPKESALEVAKATAEGLLLDATRECLIYIATLASLVEKVGPFTVLPVLILVVVVCQEAGKRVKAEEHKHNSGR